MLEALDVNLFNKLRSFNIRVPDENAAYAERRDARNGTTAIRQESEIAAPAAKPVVDAEKCIGCGLCIDVCLQEAITLSDVAKINPRKCIACGACAEECPNEAISLS
ncbi:MAG: 4Fe-4S binding protein [Acidobacteria bacterium]|nr:4Fe-4S binding protein [Acidobacteriota bacterium]